MLKKFVYNYKNEAGLAFGLRKKRGAIFKEFLERKFKDKKGLRIVDFGGTETFWKSVGYDYLREREIKITVVNLKDIDVENTDIFSSMAADATRFAADEKYDICFSNSCIEHVGMVSDMARFGEAVRNSADAYFVQTPSYFFPVEPHFFFVGFQWLPITIRAWLLRTFSFGHHTKHPDYLGSFIVAQSSYLLNRKLFAAIFHDAEVQNEKILGLTKSFIAVK